MNVFACHTDPNAAASALADAHVVKMTLETAQILSTVAHETGVDTSGLYQPTHVHHPVVQAACLYDGYRAWVLRHGVALGEEYRSRFGRTHTSTLVIQIAREVLAVEHAPSLAAAPRAMPDEFHSGVEGEAGVVASYRRYLTHKYTVTWAESRRPARWTRRLPPLWLSAAVRCGGVVVTVSGPPGPTTADPPGSSEVRDGGDDADDPVDW